jgi:hypothetical protein
MVLPGCTNDDRAPGFLALHHHGFREGYHHA